MRLSGRRLTEATYRSTCPSGLIRPGAIRSFREDRTEIYLEARILRRSGVGSSKRFGVKPADASPPSTTALIKKATSSFIKKATSSRITRLNESREIRFGSMALMEKNAWVSQNLNALTRRTQKPARRIGPRPQSQTAPRVPAHENPSAFSHKNTLKIFAQTFRANLAS